jgi:hypothetical protein
MEQQLANVSTPLASIVFDLIQHCPEQSYGTRIRLRLKHHYAPITNGMHQCPDQKLTSGSPSKMSAKCQKRTPWFY